MNRYWITFGEKSSTSNGYIFLWINKNPGSYDTDPYYVPLKPQRVIQSLFSLTTKMPDVNFEVKE